MNKNSADVKGCTMYVALFPCNECAKLIIQAGGWLRVRDTFCSASLESSVSSNASVQIVLKQVVVTDPFTILFL